MKKTLTLLFAFIMISIPTLFGQTNSEERFESVSNEEFKEAIASGDYIIIDVRTVKEYQSGHIEGAKLLDYNGDDFEQGLENMPKNQKFLVYCASGARSKGAMKKMEESGFTHVLELNKGFNNWK